MSQSMMARQEAYGDLMDRVSEAIQDRNEDLLSTLTAESEQMVHVMQHAWPDLLVRVDASPSDVDRADEVGRLEQSLERALKKVDNTQHALTQWRREIGTSLGMVNQGRIAVRGYAIGKGR